MKKIAPHFWVVLMYHILSVVGVVLFLYEYSDYDANFVKAMLVLGGGVYVIYSIATNRKIPIWFAVPFYLIISLVVISDDVNWAIFTQFNYDFSDSGSRFGISTYLNVLLARMEYDENGFLESALALNLVPLAICLLTQMKGQYSPPEMISQDSKEELLDDNWTEI